MNLLKHWETKEMEKLEEETVLNSSEKSSFSFIYYIKCCKITDEGEKYSDATCTTHRINTIFFITNCILTTNKNTYKHKQDTLIQVYCELTSAYSPHDLGM